MIVTIDGYAGSGKTTAARRLAESLGFRLLNTGGMYRAAALALVDLGVDIDAEPRDEASVARAVVGFAFDMDGGRVVLNGVDYTERIASEDAGRGASRVATFPEVRARLKQEQRRIAAGTDTICEGRDQGTAVFPDAPVKFFLSASAEIRATRRVEQLRALNLPADFATIVRQIADRDRQDETRAIDPLVAAPDAVRIDSTEMTMDEVIRKMLAEVRKSTHSEPHVS